MKRAYSYIRFSSAAQAKGESKRRQFEGAERWARENKYHLDTTLKFHDLGVGAFRGKNATQGALAAFINAVDDGKIEKGSALIVESLDRLSRQEIPDALELFLGILRRGITLVTLIPNAVVFERKTLSEVQLIIAIVILGRAWEESAVKSARGIDKWQKRRETMRAGKTIGNICPRWLRSNKERTKFEVDSAKAKIIRQMFQWFLNGEGTHAIARHLNETGTKVFGHGREWSSAQVYHYLTNRQLIGERQPRQLVDGKLVASGEPIKDYFPVVVDPDTFHRTQLQLRRRCVGRKGPRGQHVTNLFTGLIWTGTTPWNIHTASGHTTLCAPIQRSTLKKKEWRGKIHLPYDALERSILECLDELKVGDLMGKRTTAAQLEVVEARLEEVRTNLNETKAGLRKRYSETLATVAMTLEAEAKQLETRRDALFEETKTKAGESLADMQALLRKLDETQGEELKDLRIRLKAAVATVVERIEIQAVSAWSPQNRDVTIFIAFHGSQRFRHIELNIRRSPSNKGIDTRVKTAYFEQREGRLFEHGRDYVFELIG